MSKPLSTHSRLHLTASGPGALATNIIRTSLCWLCVTVLLWSRSHPLSEWRLLTALCYLAASALLVPSLAYLSLRLRGPGGHRARRETSPKLTHTLSHTGIIALETLFALLGLIAVEPLVF